VFALSFVGTRIVLWMYVSLYYWRDVYWAAPSMERWLRARCLVVVGGNVFLTALQFMWGRLVRPPPPSRRRVCFVLFCFWLCASPRCAARGDRHPDSSLAYRLRDILTWRSLAGT
jgi:hypothetical protein